MSEITRRGFFGATLAGAALPALGVAAVQNPQVADGVTVEKDVLFGKGGDVDLPSSQGEREADVHDSFPRRRICWRQ
jgi:hypothetical protein